MKLLNSDVPNELITVDGFNTERKDREGKSGGCILVYLSQSLNYKRRTDLEGEIEAIWLEISLPEIQNRFSPELVLSPDF